MDAFTLILWVVRIAFLALIYLFFLLLLRALWHDLRGAVQTAGTALGRLVVVSSPGGFPEMGTSIPLDAVTTLGRDVNNSVAIEDERVSAEHALLTFRGRVWYLEDRGSRNGTSLNGRPVLGAAVIGYGDEIGLGEVVLRLERAGTTEGGAAA